MTTYLFPGQGSQHQGMGSELFQHYSTILQQANDILGYDIQELCLHDPNRQLNQTQYTQPALFVVNMLTYLDKQKQPTFTAGHSLGEYNALLTAGVFDFKTGLRLVKYRGELMQQTKDGAMAAVIGLTEHQLNYVLAMEDLHTIDIANINTPKQIVISGPQSSLEQAIPKLTQHGATSVIPLKVSGAFHSRYMQPLRDKFAKFLKQFTFNSPKITVIANITARPYLANNIADYLSLQLTQPVRWDETIRYLISQGETEFHEIGPGKVLTNMLKHIIT